MGQAKMQGLYELAQPETQKAFLGQRAGPKGEDDAC